MELTQDLLQSFRWRNIGPFKGGRCTAVNGHPTEPMVFYMGCVGGVWKTEDGGAYWENISDGYFKTSAVGAIGVSDSDPNVIYVGMGECNVAVPRLQWTAQADGVYRSTDGGRSWANVGLKSTQHIARIRIHPEDPDLVYAAVLGHLEGDDDERGVFRSKDGGATWERVLYRSDRAGAIDMSIDPNNPRVLYVSLWDVRRSFWWSRSGGPGTGIFKSDDGGDTWTELTGNRGLPEGTMGRIAVAASPRPGRVLALIEAEKSGLYGSDDWGESWELLSDNPELTNRPHYYNHLFADPVDSETMYILNSKIHRSLDGGRTFHDVTGTHADHHELWIDPRNPQRMINGNDGGASVSFNGGKSWSNIYNQPTGEFYHITTDTRFPYRVYGTQQDNSAVSAPSRSNRGAIQWWECYNVGSSESGHIAVRPDNPNIVYAGAYGSNRGAGPVTLLYDHNSGEVRGISAWPDSLSFTFEDREYRFAWDNPLVISPHDPGVLYGAANVVFRTENDGASWEVISPDLTRNDLEEPGDFDPLTDIATFERCTISRFAESPVTPGVFWAGSDDGLIHVSTDGGESWTNVTPDGFPEWSMVSSIDASHHDAGTAYVATTRYQHGDYRPYLYRTHDYGETWRPITGGISDVDFTRVMREDPARKGLLYAGTEGGVYVSVDDGESWSRLQTNLPPVPIHDMVVKDDDLVVGTHGRAWWILDDVTPLHEMSSTVGDSGAYLFKPRDTHRFLIEPNPYLTPEPGPDKFYWLSLGMPATFYTDATPEGEPVRRYLDAGANPPDGVMVTYYLREQAEGEVRLVFMDSRGNEIATASSEPEDPSEVRLSTRQGANRYVWDMRYPRGLRLPDDRIEERPFKGPLAPPGEYQVRIEAGGEAQTQTFRILRDPRVTATDADLHEQFAMLIELRDKLTESQREVLRARAVREQVDQWVRRAEGTPGHERVSEAASELKDRLLAVEGELVSRTDIGWVEKRNRGTLFPKRLNGRLADLIDTVAISYAAPPKQCREVQDLLSSEVDARLARLNEIMDDDLEGFRSILEELEVPPIAT